MGRINNGTFQSSQLHSCAKDRELKLVLRRLSRKERGSPAGIAQVRPRKVTNQGVKVMTPERVDRPSAETVKIRQGTGPRAMVSVLLAGLMAAAVAGVSSRRILRLRPMRLRRGRSQRGRLSEPAMLRSLISTGAPTCATTTTLERFAERMKEQ